MSSDWIEYRLGELVDILSSKRIFAADYVNEGVPFYRSKEVIEKALGQEISTELYISKDTFNIIKSKNGAPQNGDILISAVGERAGIPYVVNNDGDFYFKDGNIIWLRNFSSDLNSHFVSYYFKSSIGSASLENLMIGSAQKALTIIGLKGLLISVPNIKKQKKIADILLALDEKIKCNTHINKTLEFIAQTYYKFWFVYFYPVKAKIKAKGQGNNSIMAAMMAISGKTETEISQLPIDKRNELVVIANLFPDEMEESELGDIPKGWKWVAFGELLEKTVGGDWGQDQPDEKHSEEVRIIRGTDIPTLQSGKLDKIPIRFVEPQKLKNRQLQEGDIIIEISGGSKDQPTGRSIYLTQNILNRLGGIAEPASFCRLFRPINKEVGAFLGQHLQYIYNEGKTWLYQNQSTGISNFQTTTFLENEYIALPDEKVLNTFYMRIKPILDKMTSNENVALADIRDTLLPKLLSGELIPNEE